MVVGSRKQNSGRGEHTRYSALFRGSLNTSYAPLTLPLNSLANLTSPSSPEYLSGCSSICRLNIFPLRPLISRSNPYAGNLVNSAGISNVDVDADAAFVTGSERWRREWCDIDVGIPTILEQEGQGDVGIEIGVLHDGQGRVGVEEVEE